MSAPQFARLYVCFACGYLLSYLYRSVNAVISPDLTSALGLSSSSLGLLTSVYFMAFALMQLPVGMLLDRFGPRRIEPILLSVAACGALVFAASDTLVGLGIGRALIGAGVSVCLMAPLKAIATWYPVERHASLSSWIMVAGGVGALMATSPVEAALGFMSWRVVFVVLAGATFGAALLIFVKVPDTPASSQRPGLKTQWSGVQSVFRHARFWWIAPLSAVAMGSFMAIQGLWSVPWMIDVEGYSRGEAARHLLLMNCAILGGYFVLGTMTTRLRRRGIDAQHWYGLGFGLSAVGLGTIVAGAPFSYAQWIVYGLGTSVNVLGFAVLNQGFPRQLAARANTALNLFMFGSSFAMQWGIGLVVDAAQTSLDLDRAGGLRVAFAIVLAAYVLAFSWFAYGWRRNQLGSLIGTPA
jgi:predicted MFS family arabinose efflux permease